MHLLRDLVCGPGRSREGRDLPEGEHAVAGWLEQGQPVGVIVTAGGGNLIAGTVVLLCAPHLSTGVRPGPRESDRVAVTVGRDSHREADGICLDHQSLADDKPDVAG